MYVIVKTLLLLWTAQSNSTHDNVRIYNVYIFNLMLMHMKCIICYKNVNKNDSHNMHAISHNVMCTQL